MKDKLIDGLIFAGMVITTVGMLTFCLFPFAVLLLRLKTV